MTDKVQKIREEVEKLKAQLIRGACSSQIAMETCCKEEAYNEVLVILDSLQEELVSEELKVELEKYIKDHFTIDTEQLDRFGIEEKDYMYSMDRNDMLALVEHFTNWQKTKEEPVSKELGEYINELSKQFPEVSFAKLSRIAVRVAKWQEEQFEKNRLAAYERQTEKEADIERDFVMSIIDNEHRQPTFDDAIKYGMTLQKEQMKEALRTEYEKGRYDAIEEMKKEAVEVPVCMSEDMPAVAFELPETGLK